MSSESSGATVAHSSLRASYNIYICTLGCAKNEVDSAQMRACILESGYNITEHQDDAHAVIVNTCAFIQSATEESIDTIFEFAELEGVSAGRTHIVVAGCMPARYGEDLAGELEEASAFVPCSKEDDIVEVLDKILTPDAIGTPCANMSHAVFAQQDGVFAYVKISDGCDRWCSYCTIPMIRGRYHSYTYEEIRKQVIQHVEDGVAEIVLIAQDTGRWGQDFDTPLTLSWLLDKLASEFPDTWLRVLYLEPEGVSDELLEVMTRHNNICKYLDIPLQHVDAEVLNHMNRHGSADEYAELLNHIVSRIPDITLRTTLIAGFPGETEEQFETLCDFVEDSPFTYIGVFGYSREEGTRAYDMPDQVDDDDILSRTQTLRDIADSLCTAKVADRIGKRFPVLIEGCEEDGQLYGRTQAQAPDVDGVTYVEFGTPGQIIDVTIVDTLMYEMEGEQ